MSDLAKQFVIPVIREDDPSTLESICLALADGGLTTLELTLMSEAVFIVIKKLAAKLTIGAGTVLNADQAKRALDAGAKFLVSPGLNLESVKAAGATPFFPGVLTPTEIMQAQAAGCTTLKIFPISSLGGPDYLKSLRGPFPNLKWFPSGGISLEHVRAYKAAGAVAIGMGGKLVDAGAIKTKDWALLTKAAADHVREVQAAVASSVGGANATPARG